MESMTQIKKCIKKVPSHVSLYQNLWCTWENKTLGCTRGFMGFSWFLKTSGTPRRMRFLRAPGFYRLLWIFKNIWHTLRRWDSLCVPDFIVFAWFFVEGRISGEGGLTAKIVIFVLFDQFPCFGGWQNSADDELPEDSRCLEVSMRTCDD